MLLADLELLNSVYRKNIDLANLIDPFKDLSFFFMNPILLTSGTCSQIYIFHDDCNVDDMQSNYYEEVGDRRSS